MFLQNWRPMPLLIALIITTILWAPSQPAHAQSKLLTAEDIRKIAPKAKEEFIQAFVEAEEEFEKAGINTRLRMAHFMAQVLTETGGLKRIDENMNYSFDALMRVFSRRTVSETDARRIARKPKEVANWVYGARLGNRGRDTDDGWNYRGSGFIQLTGRDNFLRRGEQIELPLAENPELAREAEAGLKAAIAYWTAVGINSAADANDRIKVRKLVNGPAAHGADQARAYFNNAWVKVFAAKESAGFESGELDLEIESEVNVFDDILKNDGFMEDNFSATESGAEDAREEAYREYQRTWGLPETGVLDEATQEQLLDPRMWRLKSLEDDIVEAENTVTEPVSEIGSGEETVVFSFDGAVDLGLGGNDSSESAGTESGEVDLSAPRVGTGQMVSDFQLKQDDILSFNNASSQYASYEMGDLVTEPEDFVPFSVIGADERVAVLNTTTFPARAVVQILFKKPNGKENLCSGTMVSPDTVLTAAHCIHSGTQSGQAFSDFRFFPGRNVGVAPFGSCKAKSARVLSGWINATSPLETREFDLGAFKLDCDVGEETGQVAIRSVEEDEIGVGTTVHGYASDKAPGGRQWISKDELRVLQDFKGFYDNDTYGGTSGAAVFATGEEGTLIGVHTNGLHGEEPWASHNAFTRITPERLEKIKEWIAE